MAATIPVTTQQSHQILMDTSDIVGYNVNWNGIQLQGFITMMHDMLQAQYEPSSYTDLYIDNCVINFLNAYYTYCENNGLPNQLNEIKNVIDTDGDGKISEKEIKDALKILKKAHMKKLNKKNKSNQQDQIVSKGLLKENFI